MAGGFLNVPRFLRTACVNRTPGVNEAPIANAGADTVIRLPSDGALLKGSGTDVDGNIVSYSWSRISGHTNLQPYVLEFLNHDVLHYPAPAFPDR